MIKKRSGGGTALFSMVRGRKIDAPLHNTILTNDDADVEMAKMAIEMAIEAGLTPADARAAYGVGITP